MLLLKHLNYFKSFFHLDYFTFISYWYKFLFGSLICIVANIDSNMGFNRHFKRCGVAVVIVNYGTTHGSRHFDKRCLFLYSAKLNSVTYSISIVAETRDRALSSSREVDFMRWFSVAFITNGA